MRPGVIIAAVAILAAYIIGHQVGRRDVRASETPAVLTIPIDAIPVEVVTQDPDGRSMRLRFACTGYARYGEREDVVRMELQRTAQ